LVIILGLSCLGLKSQKKVLRECVDYAVKNNLQVIQNEYQTDSGSQPENCQKNYLPSVSGSIGNTVSFGQTSFGTEV
jgi:outer membrane protein